MQVAVSLHAIVGRMRLVHIHRRGKPEKAVFSPHILQALQERGASMQNMVQDENRSINRMQMELIAGRVSSVNEWFY